MKALGKGWNGDKCGRADPCLFIFIFPINIHGFNQGMTNTTPLKLLQSCKHSSTIKSIQGFAAWRKWSLFLARSIQINFG